MPETTTTTLSSKGQVVIPEAIRNRLGLTPGTQFVVHGDRDMIIFKRIDPPSRDEFLALMRQARAVAKRTGMKPSDIDAAIAKVRRSKK